MTKHYVRLTHIYIYDEVIKHLFMEHVISRKQKIEIQNLEEDDTIIEWNNCWIKLFSLA